MQLNFLMVQKSNGDLAILYNQDDNVRHVPPHERGASGEPRARLAYGRLVGHWEGDVLVIDTVAIKTNAFTSTDRLGTPQTDAMHVVERYQLIGGAAAKAAQDKYEKAEGIVAGNRLSGSIRHQGEGTAAGIDDGRPECVYGSADGPRHLPAHVQAMGGTGLR